MVLSLPRQLVNSGGLISEQPRVAVIALGCPKNRVDAECVLGRLIHSGYTPTGVLDDADLLVIFTCAFIGSAVKESERKIEEILRFKRRNPGIKVVVAGCLVERYGNRLAGKYPQVDHWVRLGEMIRLPVLLQPGLSVQSRSFSDRLVSTPRHYAYLKIADGCDNRCSYCLIPRLRGRFRSREIGEVVDEAKRLADLGVKELILVAQDTTLYGVDLYGRRMLGLLIERLSEVKGINWLRLMYAHPAHLDEEVIEQFGSNPKLCRYIDLPIQHIDDEILSEMNRGYGRRDVERIISRLRDIPEMRIRTTIITGFPGETDAHFNELVDFIRTVEFDWLSGYVFSPEPGTGAYHLIPRVDYATARLRLRRVLMLQHRITRRKLRSLIGKRIKVLVDFPGQGRTEWAAPEVDGVVIIESGEFKPGEFYCGQVRRTTDYDLVCDSLTPERRDL